MGYILQVYVNSLFITLKFTVDIVIHCVTIIASQKRYCERKVVKAYTLAAAI